MAVLSIHARTTTALKEHNWPLLVYNFCTEPTVMSCASGSMKKSKHCQLISAVCQLSNMAANADNVPEMVRQLLTISNRCGRHPSRWISFKRPVPKRVPTGHISRMWLVWRWHCKSVILVNSSTLNKTCDMIYSAKKYALVF